MAVTITNRFDCDLCDKIAIDDKSPDGWTTFPVQLLEGESRHVAVCPNCKRLFAQKLQQEFEQSKPDDKAE